MNWIGRKRTLCLALLSFLSLEKPALSIDSSATIQKVESKDQPRDDYIKKEPTLLSIGQGNITEALHIEPPGHPALLLVALYAPWCRHCEPLLKEMNQALLLLSDIWEQSFSNAETIDKDILTTKKPLMGKIDATVEKNLAHYFGIKGYPTLKLVMSFPNHEYDSEKIEGSYKGKDDSIVYIFDYEDKSKSRDSIVSFILHYWFRFIYAPIPDQKDASPVIWVDTAEQLSFILNSYYELLFRVTNDFYFMETEHESKIDADAGRSNRQQKFMRDELMGEDHTVVFVICFGEGDMNDTANDDNSEMVHDSMDHSQKERLDEPSVEVYRRQLQDAYKDAAFKMIERKDIAFFAVKSSSCQELGLTIQSPIKAIFAPFHEQAIRNAPVYQTAPVRQTIMDFVKEQSAPRLVWFDRQKNASLVFRGDFSIHVSLFVRIPESNDPESKLEIDEDTKRAIASMKESANKYVQHKESVFLIVPHTEQRILNYFGVSTFPTLMITDMRQRNGTLKYFLRPNEIIQSYDSIPDFYEQFYSNQVDPTFKSQPLSDDDTEKPVKIVKGDSFNSMVMEGAKHALVNFYAPWCAHCKHLTPKWNKLAATIAQSEEWMDKIDIMKMDATKNEVVHPSIDIVVFPTIYLFPLGNKSQPILYKGNGTDPDDFIEWFSSYELKLNTSIEDKTGIFMDSTQSIGKVYDEL